VVAALVFVLRVAVSLDGPKVPAQGDKWLGNVEVLKENSGTLFTITTTRTTPVLNMVPCSEKLVMNRPNCGISKKKIVPY
jgi:hypothetical protein